MTAPLRDHARKIWQSAVDAARPRDVVRAALTDPGLPVARALQRTPRILVVGAGKAGAAMSLAVEEILADALDRMEGLVNVPASPGPQPVKIRLHAARPAGTNQPTAEGVAGAGRILDLVAGAGPEDVALCLLSGGGSALLPAPVSGVTLEDKQQVTRLLHACGATINEMNCVRKHLSRIKGGGLARAFTGKALFSLIISDVIGDPLDVIASGPTAADPTTFADALAVLARFNLLARVPAGVLRHLQAGQSGAVPETLKVLPAHVHNFVIANNAQALKAARATAAGLGYRVLNLGSFLEGETRQLATVMAGIVRAIRSEGEPSPPPVCLLSGGETTVTLAENHGKGGRNQEFVLAAALALGSGGLRNVVILSGGTDGEDGPTDAAGATADEGTWARAASQGLDASGFLARNDAYAFFERTGDLLRTGLTQTNVMDVRVILVT
jgi:hydroxypyruvate reductase/glycerate 2-kinase